LQFVRTVDQAIAEKHHKGLRYPAHLLAHALTQALRGVSIDEVVRDALRGNWSESDLVQANQAAADFEVQLRENPHIRPGVDSGLEKIHHLGIPIAVVTEGSSETCRLRLRHWGLESFVAHVISAPKSPELFMRVANLLGVTPNQCYVIGDQLDRDIAPARQIGASTVYFPGGFTPRWAPSVDAVKPDFTIHTFDEVVSIVHRGA
jgi:putative hydrolase of the HAD superfamily